MNMQYFLTKKEEHPLENLVSNGGFCSIFKKIASIGASMDSGEFESHENGRTIHHDMYEYSWGQYMAKDAGCTVYNFSKGGMTAKDYEDFALENGFYDDKYRSQAYIITLGTNDIGKVVKGEIELGDVSDVDVNDYANNKPTVIGYYAKIIAKYKLIQPKAKFFLVSRPKEDAGMPEDELKRKYVTLHDEFARQLENLTKIFDNCYFMDVRKYGPIYDEEFKRNFYLGGHMNPMGYRLVALLYETYIDYIIRHNPEDFKQVGFIGTAYHNVNAKW